MWICPNCRTEIESDFGICWDCGTTLDSLREGRTGHSADQDAVFIINGPPYPVSVNCPECGSRVFRPVRATPWIWTLLRRDRICQECRIRFVPPTPVWAQVTYLVSGFLLVMSLLMAILAAFAPQWTPAWACQLCPPVGFLAAHVFWLVTLIRE